MTHPAPLLDLPFPIAARLIALGHLERAARAADELAGSPGEEALHAFRVALRRLANTLVDLAPHLGGRAGRKRKRIQRLCRRTERGRDAEVDLAWLRIELDALDDDAAPLQWLATHLEGRRDAARRADVAALPGQFARLGPALRRRLSRLTLRVDPDEGYAAPPPLRLLLAAVAAERLDALGSSVAAIGEPGQRSAIRVAAESARRLRHLLEPVRPEIPELPAELRRLKRLEDLLADLLDLQRLAAMLADLGAAANAEDDPPRSAEPLPTRLSERAGAVFAELRREWLDLDPRERFAGLGALVDALHPDPARDPFVEIERKFLLDGMPTLPDEGVEVLEVEQGYIPGERLHERLRRTRRGTGEDRFFRAVKHGAGVQRLELEEETTGEIFATLWPLTDGRRVRKTRFQVRVGDRVWEIDRFDDRDLVLAEVELPTPDAPAAPPAWLAPHVVREVTDDPDYLNLNLAR